jgi:DNA polymerase-1
MLRKMQRNGFRIDPQHFSDLSRRLTARMADLRADILNEIPAEALDRFLEVSGDDGSDEDEPSDEGFGFNVESSAKVAELLYTTLRLDGTAGVKVKKTKGGDRLSTGKKTLEQLKRSHPVVPLILEYRENSKLESTYARAMVRRARFHPKGHDCPVCGRHHWSDEWRVHTQILTTRTPARFSSKGPNLQNIPIKGDLGKEIRAGFIASIGHKIVQRDWSQIELRLLADRSGDPVLVAVYVADGDVHEKTAEGLFGGSEGSTDAVTRRISAKTANFSIVYGTTEVGLYEQLCDSFSRLKIAFPAWLSEAGCKKLIDDWYALYEGVRVYLQDEESKMRRWKIVWTACGRVLRMPEVSSYHSYVQSAGVRRGCNHGIQGFAADLMRLAMGEAQERFDLLTEYGIDAAPILSIHDELLVEVPEDDAETVQAVLGEVMDNVLFCRSTGRELCRVPIRSDGKILERWTKS